MASGFPSVSWPETLVRPFLEYDFGQGGDFTTSDGDSGSFELEDGTGFGVNVGSDLDEDWRWEANFRYRESGIAGIGYDRAVVDGYRADGEALDHLNNTVHYSGDVHQVSVGASVWYEVDTVGDFTPYVGGGIHYTYVTLDEVGVTAGGRTTLYDDGDGAFGVTLGVGVGYDMTESMEVNLGYRYHRSLEEFHFDGSSDGEGRELTLDNLAGHSIMVGVNIDF